MKLIQPVLLNDYPLSYIILSWKFLWQGVV